MKKSLTAIILTACIGCNVNELDFTDLQKPTLNSHVALPIGTISYTMREMINEIGDTELQLEEDSTSLIKLTYFDSAHFDGGEELISIADVNNRRGLPLPVIEASSESQTAVADSTFEFTYPAENNEALDSVFYKAGTLQITVQSNTDFDISYEFTINQTINTSTRIPISFSGDLGARQTASSSQNLIGHRTEFEQVTEGDSTTNLFEVHSRLTVYAGPGESSSGSETIEVTLSYLDQEFTILYGKFGQDELKVGNEVLNIKFFEELGESGLKFGSPELTFNFSNNFGLPLGILFDGLYAVDSSSNGLDTTYLSGSAAENPQIVEGAQTEGEAVSSVVVLNNQNSSIRDLLASSPRSLGFSLTAIANPEDASASNYVMDTSRISTTIQMELPMELSLDNLEREFDFDLGDGLSFDETDSVNIRIVSDNELPFAAHLELEILGENDSIIYSVPGELVLETPFLNLNGVVTQPRRHTADIPIGKAGIEGLATGEKLRIRLILNTPTGSREFYVKILADYSLKLKVSAVGKLKLDL